MAQIIPHLLGWSPALPSHTAHPPRRRNVYIMYPRTSTITSTYIFAGLRQKINKSVANTTWAKRGSEFKTSKTFFEKISDCFSEFVEMFPENTRN